MRSIRFRSIGCLWCVFAALTVAPLARQGKKVYISVDLEGISGVNGDDQTSAGQPEYGRARKLMAEDANAAIRGAFDGGAADVLVNDSHGGQRNLLPEDLDPRARLISHSFKRHGMMEGLDESAEKDPKQMMRFLERFQEATGLEAGPKMEEMMARLAEGADVDELEDRLGGGPAEEDPYGEGAAAGGDDDFADFFRKKKEPGVARSRPRVDDTLYFL